MPRRNLELGAAVSAATRLSATQADACTIAQARVAGLSDSAVRRLTVSGAWQHLHRGVYLTRRGPADLAARMWGAHLALGTNSVVGGRTAGRFWGLIEAATDPAEPVVVVMPDNCSRVASGVLIRRVPDPSRWAHPARRPPVLTVEHTVLELFASARTTAEAVDVVLRSCRLRITSPARLLAAAAARPRLRGRDLFTRLCADVGDGVTSPLEREYQRRVARPHRLPAGIRQAPAGGASRRAYRDVRYAALGVIVELDGRLGHETESDVFRDQRRDNAAVLSGDATLRFGWVAVAGHPCEVAAQVGALLRLRGWTGRPARCGPDCSVLEGW